MAGTGKKGWRSKEASLEVAISGAECMGEKTKHKQGMIQRGRVGEGIGKRQDEVNTLYTQLF
jgi:hypothetical protein